jgi:aspartate kinase
MTVVVQKYGGSSLSTLDKVRSVAERVARDYRSGTSTVVVVSARGDTTNELLHLARQVGGPGAVHLAREVDQLLVTGECASAALLAIALDRESVPAVSLTGPQAGIMVVGPYGAGVIDNVRTERIRRLLDEGKVVVVGGFHGLDDQGDAVTLGRGGSDTTAVALAVALGAARCEIYTDVEGVFTADPRFVPGARKLSTVEGAVMAELAFAGAKVLHPRSVELAAMNGVDVHVRSSAEATAGTVVVGGAPGAALETAEAVVAIAVDSNVARVLVHSSGIDLAPWVLGLLARHAVPVDLVARSGPQEDEFRMGFTVRGTDLAKVRPALEEMAGRHRGAVRVDADVAKVSLVGLGLLDRPEHLARMTAALANAGIPVSWVSMSQLRVSVIVPDDRCREAVGLLHTEFGLEQGDGAPGQPVTAGSAGKGSP